MKVVSYWANIPEGVKVIPKDCFGRRMSFYIFPPGLKAIDDRAFENEGMGSINLPEGLESIGFRAFFNAGTARTLNIPDSVRYIGPQALVLQCLEKIEVSSRNMHYTSLRGVLFDKDVKTLIKYPKMMEEDVYYVPDTVETIADYAFYQANISKVVLPKRLKRIGAAAF